MNGFEEQYLKIRQKEKRLYADEEVKHLPDIAPWHVHYREWQFRKRSATRLMRYLEKKKRALNMLEVGCGNGWLSAKLAMNSSFNEIGRAHV